MTAGRACTAAITAVNASIVTVEAVIGGGTHEPGAGGCFGTCEQMDRVRAAVINSGEPWPREQVTVTASPPVTSGAGAGTDLAMAVAILTACGQIPEGRAGRVMFWSEVGLDGRLRPARGTLAAARAAREHGVLVVAEGAAGEAAAVPGVSVVAAGDLRQVLAWLRIGPVPAAAARGLDFVNQPGLPGEVVSALELCAAGGHHVSVTGRQRPAVSTAGTVLAAIMPALDEEAALDAAAIRAAAGTWSSGDLLSRAAPVIAAHHTATAAEMLGGAAGGIVRPGLVSLAHHGVLLLGEAPEFRREVLDSLRQPLAHGRITLARAGQVTILPASFRLVLTAGLCGCRETHLVGCECTPAQRRRYLGRVSGPLTDQIAVKVTVAAQATMTATTPEATQIIAGRVLAAAQRAAYRLEGTGWRLNAEVPGEVLRRDFPPPADGAVVLDRAVENGQVSERGAVRALRVAWTLADLDDRPRPDQGDCIRALGYLTGATA